MYYDCDTEFRSFWTHNKLHEEDGLMEDTPYKFSPLARFSCDQKSLNSIATKTFEFGVPAGYFIYHKEAHYWAGPSPLMGHVSQISDLL